MTTSSRRVARLLSGRDQPGVVEREQMLSQIIAAPRAPRSHRCVGARGLAGLGVLLFSLLWFANIPFGDGAGASALSREGVDIDCGAGKGPANRCDAEARLQLAVRASHARPYLSILLVASGGHEEWYESRRVVAEGHRHTKRTGLVLEKHLQPGRYRVVALLSSAPMSLSEARSIDPGEIAGTGSSLRIRRHEFVVESD